MTDNESSEQDQQITSIADAVIKLKEIRESNKNLNAPDIEEKFARLSLAFKTDKVTLGKRLDLQLRQRDIAEKNIESELRALRESLNALNQLCTESDMREVITKTQQHVDIVQQATMRMSSRAETYGAIQQEQRMNCAFETMLNYVEHLKLLYDKEHLELEDYRRLLEEHNLLPNEKSALDDDPKHLHLPPRSLSLSSSSKPEPRTRLLSAVCLLNNNHHDHPNPGSLSPKSRRCSLPVGPLTHPSTAATSTAPLPSRAHASIQEMRIARRESKSKILHDNHLARLESVEPPANECEDSEVFQKPAEEETPDLSDSSELNLSNPIVDQETAVQFSSLLQESTCDNETDSDVFLLPELKVPVKSKPLYLLDLFRRASACPLLLKSPSHPMGRLSNSSLVLHARYALSATLAAAALLTLLLTFLPHCMVGRLF